jgi:hypothetical protein
MRGEDFQEGMIDDHSSVEAVRDHYDRLTVFYRALWGDHIHHGYWENDESPARAQVKLGGLTPKAQWSTACLRQGRLDGSQGKRRVDAHRAGHSW